VPGGFVCRTKRYLVILNEVPHRGRNEESRHCERSVAISIFISPKRSSVISTGVLRSIAKRDIVEKSVKTFAQRSEFWLLYSEFYVLNSKFCSKFRAIPKNSFFKIHALFLIVAQFSLKELQVWRF
jgi:hypothetical protein